MSEAIGISCIYEGTVRHRRQHPAHEFRYRLALAYLDLDELPELLGGRLVRRRPGLLRFRRADYFGDPRQPLAEAVRDRVQTDTGRRPEGPVRILTQLRSFGHCFNPVSLYYCFAPDGERLEVIVAEVTSTPWRERHAYVLAGGGANPRLLRAEAAKRLHVSPFMGMSQRYAFSAAVPDETLSLHIDSSESGSSVFDATLGMRRRELDVVAVRRLAFRFPLATVRVLTQIYAQALALRLAGARVHPHPQAGG